MTRCSGLWSLPGWCTSTGAMLTAAAERRRAVVLAYASGLTMRRVAVELGVSTGAVQRIVETARSRASRGLRESGRRRPLRRVGAGQGRSPGPALRAVVHGVAHGRGGRLGEGRGPGRGGAAGRALAWAPAALADRGVPPSGPHLRRPGTSAQGRTGVGPGAPEDAAGMWHAAAARDEERTTSSAARWAMRETGVATVDETDPGVWLESGSRRRSIAARPGQCGGGLAVGVAELLGVGRPQPPPRVAARRPF